VIGTGATLQALAGAFLVRHSVGFPTALDHGRDVLIFLLLSGPVSCLVAASVGGTTLMVSGQIPWATFPLQWGTWWVGDTLGILITTPLALSWLAEPRPIWRRRRLSVALPLASALALAVGVFAYTSAQEQERQRLLFERQAAALGHIFQHSLDNYLDVLVAVESYYLSAGGLTRHALHTFVQRASHRYPGLQAVSWDRRVPDTLREAYEQSLRQEGESHFQITEQAADGQLVPAAQRPEYVVVTYIEPSAGNERALGFDVASTPDRRDALQRARDLAQPSGTGRLRLVQESGHHWGVLVFLPIYRQGLAPATVEDRRRSLQGYVTAVIRIDTMVEASLQHAGWEGMVLRLEDEAAPRAQRVLYERHGRGVGAPSAVLAHEPKEISTGMRWEAPIELAGRRWGLQLAPTLEYLARQQSLQPWAVLGGGLVFTSLLGAFLLVVTGRSAVIEQLVAERTAQLEAANQELVNEIVERTRVEEALRASEQKFRSVVESAPDAIVLADSAGTLLAWNPAAQAIFRYGEDELIGTPLTRLMPERYRDTHRSGLARFRATGESRVIGGTVQVHGLRQDGSEFPIELALSSWQAGAETFYCGIIRDITIRQQTEAAIRTLNDTLEQRVAELKATNQELATLSYSIAHDLRAPLRAIHSFSRILLEDYAAQLDAEAQSYLQRVSANALRMGRLIDDLLAFGQLSYQPLLKRPVAPADLVHEVLADLRPEYAHRQVELIVQELPPCQADPVLLKQVWANLVGNALKFTRGRPVTRIEVGCDAQAAGGPVYFVRDNGVGFEMQYADKLFGVFQRLHNVADYEGTGVGLALTQRIVHRHGGRIWAEAAVDQGATFFWTLGQ
jgi:PAS domain S-box-containing protein